MMDLENTIEHEGKDWYFVSCGYLWMTTVMGLKKLALRRNDLKFSDFGVSQI